MKKCQRVTVGGLLVLAAVAVASGQPGDGIHVGQWVLSPFVDLGGFYDSNIWQDAGKTRDDVFFDSTIGLRAGYTAFNLDGNAMGFLSSRSYADATEKDFDVAGEMLRVKYGTREQVVLELSQSFRRVEDIDVYGAEAAVGGVSPDSVMDAVTRNRRDVSQAGLSAGRNVTDKMDVDVGYRYDAVDYDDSDLLDLDSHVAQIEASHRMTDKTAGFVTLKGGLQGSDALGDSAEYQAAWLGWKTRGTDKLSWKAGGGIQRYDRPEDQGEETGFNFDASAAWLATEKVTVQGGARNGIQLSPMYEDNAAEFAIFWLGGAYRMTPTVVLSGNGAYRVDDYLDPVAFGGASVDREDKGAAVRVRADYLVPARFMKVYADVSYESVDSTVGDYDETRAGLGVQLRY